MTLVEMTCELHTLALLYDQLMESGDWDRAGTVMLRFAELEGQIKIERLRVRQMLVDMTSNNEVAAIA